MREKPSNPNEAAIDSNPFLQFFKASALEKEMYRNNSKTQFNSVLQWNNASKGNNQTS